MRVLKALLLCGATLTALTALFADACFAHVWLGRVAADAAARGQLVQSDQKKSKLPCYGEHPPSYCKPKKGAK
jgi:hypothetical protein